MKLLKFKVISIVAFVLIACGVHAQVIGSKNTTLRSLGRLQSDSGYINANYDTSHAAKVTGTQIYSGGFLYLYTGAEWMHASSEALGVNIKWFTPYVSGGVTYWDSAFNNAETYLKTLAGGGKIFVPNGEFKTQEPIFLQDYITIVGEGEGSWIHNVRNNFFRGITIAQGWFQQTDFGSHNLVTDITDISCQMYGMANYPRGQKYVTLLQDSSFNHLSVGNSIMIRKGFYPLPTGVGVIDSVGEATASDFLDIRNIDSLDRPNLRVYLDAAIPDSVWLYPGTVDTQYMLHVTRLINGRPANPDYWNMPSSYMVKNATVQDLRVSSDSSSWTTRTAAYKCTFKNIYVSFSKYGIGGNCWTNCLFDNIYGRYRMRGIEHAEGGYYTTFRNIKFEKINPDPRPQLEPTIVLQNGDELGSFIFRNNKTAENTMLYMRGNANVHDGVITGKYASFAISFIGKYNHVHDVVFNQIDTTWKTLINSANVTSNGISSPDSTVGNVFNNNTFNGKMADATATNPLVSITGSDNTVSGNIFNDDTTNTYIITAGVRNKIYNNFNEHTGAYHFSSVYPNNWISANFYLGSNSVVDSSWWGRSNSTAVTALLTPKNVNDSVYAKRLTVANEMFNSSMNVYADPAGFNPIVRIGTGEFQSAKGYQIQGRYQKFATSQTVGSTDKSIVLVEPTLAPDPDTLTLEAASTCKNKVLTVSVRSTTNNIWYISGTWTSILALSGTYNSVQAGNQFVPTNLRLMFISDGTNWKCIDSTNTAASVGSTGNADSLGHQPASYYASVASVALKVNSSDTAAMLSPYLRSNIAAATYATIANLALKNNISDTAAMLSPYLRSNVAAATYITASSINTLTNKTLTGNTAASFVNTGTISLPTVTGTAVQYFETAITTSATPTPTGDARVNWLDITALAAGATFSAPSGTPLNHNELIIRIKDDGTARNLTFNAIYRFSTDLPAPAITLLGKVFYIKFVYNSASSTWDCLSQLNNF